MSLATRKRVFACHESLSVILHVIVDGDMHHVGSSSSSSLSSQEDEDPQQRRPASIEGFRHPLPPLAHCMQQMLTPRKVQLSHQPSVFAFTRNWTVAFLYRGDDRAVRVVDPLSGRTLRHLVGPKKPVSICVVEDYIVVGDEQHKGLLIFDSVTCEMVAKVLSPSSSGDQHLEGPTKVAALSGGCCIVAETKKMELRIFRVVDAALNGDFVKDTKPPSRHVKTINFRVSNFTVLHSSLPDAGPCDDTLLIWKGKQLDVMSLVGSGSNRKPPRLLYKTQGKEDEDFEGLHALAHFTRVVDYAAGERKTVRPVMVFFRCYFRIFDPDTATMSSAKFDVPKSVCLVQRNSRGWLPPFSPFREAIWAPTADGKAVGFNTLLPPTFNRPEFTLANVDAADFI